MTSSSILIIFSLVLVSLSAISSACDCGGGGSPLPPVHPKSPPSIKHSPPPTTKSPPKMSVPPPSPPKSPSPSPPKSPSPSPPAVCTIDTLKLGVCANLLGIVVIDSPSSSPCCTLLNGLTDLQVTLCLCTAIKADVLGIHLNIPVSLSVIVNDCGKSVPSGFKCA